MSVDWGIDKYDPQKLNNGGVQSMGSGISMFQVITLPHVRSCLGSLTSMCLSFSL